MSSTNVSAKERDDDRGWNLHFREDDKQWELSYRVRPGKWSKHRVPRQFATEPQAEKYSTHYVAAKRRNGFAPTPRRSSSGGEDTRVSTSSGGVTFGSFATDWTTGKLHRAHPDHVRQKRTRGDDVERLALLDPLIGDVPLARFTLDDADRAMAGLEGRREEREAEAARRAKRDPRELQPLTPSSRRQYAQLIGRVLKLAVYPGRHIATSPIPKGWLPRPNDKKARSFIYPSEDATLMACAPAKVPLWRRLLWGFIAREGTRGPSEALSLRWRHLDLVRGVVRLDVNKTDDPRFWTLNPAVAAALRTWKTISKGGTEPKNLVFVDDDGAQVHETQLADLLRTDLKAAKIDRPELFEHNAHRLQLRAHDLRASFITVALANGRSETWVTDRTGHTTSGQLMNYRRAARSVRELDLGDWRPLDDAIPELRTKTTKPRRKPREESATKRNADRALVAELVAAALSRTLPRNAKSTSSQRFQRVDSNHDKRNQNPLSCH